MDNDTQVKEPAASALPHTSAFQTSSPFVSPAVSTAATIAPTADMDGTEQTGVFLNLVKGDGDIAGLVAYSIYKQNKLDWLRAFQTVQGRAPNEAELASYIIGEGTPRRLATYRHLAEATLAGNGPSVGTSHNGSVAQRGRSALAARSLLNPGLVALYALIALLFVLGFWFALHYTMTTR